MFGKNRMSEIVLTKTSMFIFSFCQQILEIVWQGERKDILQATIFSKEKVTEDGTCACLGCTYSATVCDRGTLVEVKVQFDMTHHSDRNLWGWVIVHFINFQVCSVRAIKDVVVPFSVDAAWENPPKVVCDASGAEKLREVWKGLGLETNVVIKTSRFDD